MVVKESSIFTFAWLKSSFTVRKEERRKNAPVTNNHFITTNNRVVRAVFLITC